MTREVHMAGLTTLRRQLFTRPLFRWARRALPRLSDTERAALQAGDVWWDAELFAGNPQWQRLLDVSAPRLSAAEQAFIDGPVQQLCDMLDDWQISWEEGDLPEAVWGFLKQHRFFGMIIPESYGGLGFSAFAHSEVVRIISTRSTTAAVTVMVPNSLGPGELLLQYGTDAQRDYWLPRLADGREIPAFGLTSPEAGSDAAAMTDTGVVCRGEWHGEQVIGIRLNWHKRYITLGPVCSVLGLAFKLRDPDALLGDTAELGITVALVPTHLPGISIGRRHLPAYQVFQNGPNWGTDVFLPLDHIVGEAHGIGRGWPMLMGALAAGRGISLPSQSAAAAAFCARTTGAYARIRQQFGIPIGDFEGVGRRLGRLAGRAYLLDGARRLTCAGLDEGRKLAVISGIMKAQATFRMRESVDDAMDVHAGKGVIDGPSNYLGNIYRAVPVGITVEGANILTRNLIIFGQGAIRCHPYLLDEIRALEAADDVQALTQFDAVFWRHVGHTVRTLLRAWGRRWSRNRFAPAPVAAGSAAPFYRQMSGHAAAFALLADVVLLTIGGALKRKELLSARLGDILSELYLLSGALKRWHDDGRHDADFPLLRFCIEEGCSTIERRFDEVLANLPNRPVARLLRAVIRPSRRAGASDELLLEVGRLLLQPSPTRERITERVYRGCNDDAVARLERAFELTIEAAPLHAKLKSAGVRDWRAARDNGLISDAEAHALHNADAAVARAIEVDDFPADAFARTRTPRAPQGRFVGAT
jgi:acyl-CoA dehydrogenase